MFATNQCAQSTAKDKLIIAKLFFVESDSRAGGSRRLSGVRSIFARLTAGAEYTEAQSALPTKPVVDLLADMLRSEAVALLNAVF
jgi:hypothetical protein